jgi:predicted MFS family arabinose efflux permease
VNREGAPRSAWQLVTDRRVGILFWGKLASLSAVWAFAVVSVTLAFDLTGSAAWVGMVGAAGLAPQLALALLAGRLSDTRGPLTPIIGGMVLSGLAALALAGWTVGGQGEGDADAWVLLAASLIFGCGLALSSPALHSLMPRLVTPAELPAAAALNFLPMALARTIGPVLGATVAVAFGYAGAFFCMGVVSIATGATFSLVRLGTFKRAASGTDARIRSAVGYAARTRVLLAPLVGVAALGVGAEPAVTLAPILNAGIGHGGEGAGIIVSAFGAGGLLGVAAHRLLVRRMSSMAEGIASMWLLAGSMAGAGLAESLTWLALAMGSAGLCLMAGLTAFSVAVQQNCPPDMMGRVMALWGLAFAGTRPIASLAQGFLADGLGTGPTLFITAGLVVSTAVWTQRATRTPGVSP